MKGGGMQSGLGSEQGLQLGVGLQLGSGLRSELGKQQRVGAVVRVAVRAGETVKGWGSGQGCGQTWGDRKGLGLWSGPGLTRAEARLAHLGRGPGRGLLLPRALVGLGGALLRLLRLALLRLVLVPARVSAGRVEWCGQISARGLTGEWRCGQSSVGRVEWHSAPRERAEQST